MSAKYIDVEEKDHIKYEEVRETLRMYNDKRLVLVIRMWEKRDVDKLMFMVVDNSIPEVTFWEDLESAVLQYNKTPGGDE